MATSPLQGWTIPGGGDAPANASAFATLAAAVEKQSNMRFASPAARDSAIATGSRLPGMTAWIDSLGYFTVVKTAGGAWFRLADDNAYAGGESVVVGSSPSAGTFKIRREFTAVLTVQTGSAVSGSWLGGAFPNGITYVSMVPGDIASNLGQVIPSQGSMTLSTFAASVLQPNGSGITTGNVVRVNFQLVGW